MRLRTTHEKNEGSVSLPSGSACALAVFTSQILTHPSMDAVTAQEDEPAGKWQAVAEAPEKNELFIRTIRTLAHNTYDAVQGSIRAAHCPSPT